jgi:hypothetical protein
MSRRGVTIFNAYDLLERPEFYRASAAKVELPDHSKSFRWIWVPARPLAPSWHQWKALWLVWTGRADVLHWPGQER